MADYGFVADSNPSAMGKEKAPDEKLSSEPGTVDTVDIGRSAAATDSSVRAQELLDHGLHFLSTASNETLGACLAGLGAATYFILGRVGLVLIGIVGGIVLHATWEGSGAQSGEQTESAEEKSRRKREDGLKILQRVLDWRGQRYLTGSDVDEDGHFDAVQVKTSAQKQLDFSEFEPLIGAALTGLTDAVIRDYVKWWYGPLSPNDLSFPSACRQTLTSFLLSISSHLSRKRPADVFLDFLTNSSSIIIVFLNELSNALTASVYSEAVAADLLHQYLEQNPSSSLANVLDLSQQHKKLQVVSEDILQAYLDPKAYECGPVRIFLRQMLADVCLEMSVQSCSKPDWINSWIVYLLEQDEPELISAIDTSVGDATAAKTDEQAVSADDTQDKLAIFTADSPKDRDLGHKRTVSRAEEAMDEAMQEAKRLSEMIAAEEAKRVQANDDHVSSGTTTGAETTPTSSQSDLEAQVKGPTSSPGGETAQEPVAGFTSFDQLLTSQPPTALQPGHTRAQSVVPPLTLHNASISIFDDAMPGDKGTLRSKPTTDYLLQVEPATPQHPGWMIARKYADFETLHEVLRRISVVSGVPEFADKHSAIPPWKNRSKEAIRVELERYLRDSLSFSRLAESEGMKRFLEKDQGLDRSSPSTKQGGFGFPTPAAFESMGKGMLDVLSAAPKGAAGGGKAILGGVTGVLGGVGALGQRKQATLGSNKSAQSSKTNLMRVESDKSWAVEIQGNRISQDIPRSSLNELDRASTLPLEPRPGCNDDLDTGNSSHTPSSHFTGHPQAANDSLSMAIPDSQSPRAIDGDETTFQLPPPPSEIPDDWSTSAPVPRTSSSIDDKPASSTSFSSRPLPPPRPKLPKPPLTEQETRVAIELFFATITSLYTLSSAWSIRRTLLSAAKNFLLRPGNPNLEAIRVLIQDTVINANISDAGLASHIHKIRENSLPTEAELKTWPPPPSEDEKTKLRQKARKLLVEKGMPQALTSVMGQAASGEALGRVFDALQIEEVARGLVFALILQGVRAMTQ
ncbi:MAG: hypothetical protein Q9216_003802 [Gyalolechia sp. 2 TL-2023]